MSADLVVREKCWLAFTVRHLKERLGDMKESLATTHFTLHQLLGHLDCGFTESSSVLGTDFCAHTEVRRVFWMRLPQTKTKQIKNERLDIQPRSAENIPLTQRTLSSHDRLPYSPSFREKWSLNSAAEVAKRPLPHTVGFQVYTSPVLSLQWP